MSLSRVERLFLGVEPDRLSLVRLSQARVGKTPPIKVAAESVPLGPAKGYDALFDGLRERLNRAPWIDAAETSIVVADSLARYFIVRAPKGARSIDEIQLVGQSRFEKIYSTSSEDWQIEIGLEPFAEMLLACALPKALVTGLVGSIENAHLSVRTIKPFAISEFDRSERTIGSQDGWLVVAGSEGIWIGYRSCRGWLSVHHAQLTSDIVTALSVLLEQECLRDPMLMNGRHLWIGGQYFETHRVTRVGDREVTFLDGETRDLLPEGIGTSERLALSEVWPRCR